MHSNIVATSFELIGTMGERSLVGVQICVSLLDLLCMLSMALTRMSKSLLSEKSDTNDRRKLHDVEVRYASNERLKSAV